MVIKSTGCNALRTVGWRGGAVPPSHAPPTSTAVPHIAVAQSTAHARALRRYNRRSTPVLLAWEGRGAGARRAAEDQLPAPHPSSRVGVR